LGTAGWKVGEGVKLDKLHWVVALLWGQTTDTERPLTGVQVKAATKMSRI